jgi:hypothetical protein
VTTNAQSGQFRDDSDGWQKWWRLLLLLLLSDVHITIRSDAEAAAGR